MKIPVIQGVIRRRLLVNFRVDPAVMQKSLPAPFRPKLHRGQAIAGICLIRLEQIRPVGVPVAAFGISSENAAHRVAVEWTTSRGELREGVYIHRRDTDSVLNHLAGGRIFPGVHHLADFSIDDDLRSIDFKMTSRDGGASIRLHGEEAEALPASSCFASLAESSQFFERGCVGYSPGHGHRFDGMRLETAHWAVRALSVRNVESSWFTDLARTYPGSAELDHALVMRDIPHRWRAEENLS